jgi:hypothetical protein
MTARWSPALKRAFAHFSTPSIAFAAAQGLGGAGGFQGRAVAAESS